MTSQTWSFPWITTHKYLNTNTISQTSYPLWTYRYWARSQSSKSWIQTWKLEIFRLCRHRATVWTWVITRERAVAFPSALIVSAGSSQARVTISHVTLTGQERRQLHRTSPTVAIVIVWSSQSASRANSFRPFSHQTIKSLTIRATVEMLPGIMLVPTSWWLVTRSWAVTWTILRLLAIRMLTKSFLASSRDLLTKAQLANSTIALLLKARPRWPLPITSNKA